MRRKLVFYLFLFTGIALASLFSNVYFGQSICFFHNFFGIPCLSCGMTRAYLFLFQGNWKMAFHYHPLFWTIPIVIWSLLYSKKIFYFLGSLFLLVWIYRMIFYFPLEEPMVWNPNAFYVQIFQKIKDIVALWF